MDKEMILEYILQQGYAEIPSIQRQFKLSYSEARQAVNELVQDKYLVFDSGIRYSVAYEYIDDPFAALKPFEVNIDDYEHIDGLNKADPCVKEWLYEKVKANSDITLKKALSLVKAEQKEASAAKDDKKSRNLRKVASYLKGLDVFMFYLAKRHVTE